LVFCHNNEKNRLTQKTATREIGTTLLDSLTQHGSKAFRGILKMESLEWWAKEALESYVGRA
jgi:hypothetical protein